MTVCQPADLGFKVATPLTGEVMSFEVRSAEEGDARMVARLVRRSYRGDASRSGWTSPAHWVEGLRTDENQIRALIHRPDAAFLVGEQTDTMVACCQIENRGRIGYLGMLAVDPEHQAFGFGRRMVLEAEATARAWGTRGMQIVVLDRQPELVSWYERQGYVKTGERVPYPADERFGRPTIQSLNFETLLKGF